MSRFVPPVLAALLLLSEPNAVTAQLGAEPMTAARRPQPWWRFPTTAC